ncbi:MAG TPA: hypothetical protein VHU17_11435 [Acidimicrobiales bacterium]|nr:hypothetical protein [Acidimicrobiales bacterium]
MDDDEGVGDEVVPGPVEDRGSVDPESGPEPSGETPGDPLRFDRWRRRSAAGAMMTGIAFGMQEALDQKRKEPPIVQQVDGDPGPQGPIELQFDPDHPEKTVAVIRPWLMNEAGTAADEPDGTTGASDH